jgi:4-alpha-glucanotransferase
MADAITHDSRNPAYRSPLGAVPCATDITLRLRIDAGYETPRVLLRLWIVDRESYIVMQDRGISGMWRMFEAVVEAPAQPCLIWYHFRLESGGNTYLYGNNEEHFGGTGRLWDDNPAAYQITVYDARFAPPRWMRDGIVYQIFPDRFYDGYDGELLKRRPEIKVHEDWHEPPDKIEEGRTGDNVAKDFFGGNLKGVEQKLDYLKSLNVSAIYLNPIFKAHSNHKYDTGDYHAIDPTFGDEEDFRSLCAAARKKGIHVILDGVFSHTGEDSLYFNRYGRYPEVGAYQSEDSKYYPWYKFKQYPDDYECWWGVPTLPEVNEMHPLFLDHIIRGQKAVIAKWLRLGAGGWRLDVADELPDEFIFMLRERVKTEVGTACIIGEVWEDATNKVAYGQPRAYALGRGLDSVMNYPLRAALIDFLLGRERASRTRRRILSQKENYPRPMFYALMNLLGSHDRARILNVLADCESPDIPEADMGAYAMNPEQYEVGKLRLMLMVAVVAALPGMPTIYYGDEAGVQGLKDPFCRRTYPWGREDGEVLAHFRQVMEMRRLIQVLRSGELDVFAPHPDVLCVLRTIRGGIDALGAPSDDETAFVAVNRSDTPRRVTLDLSPYHIEMLFDIDGGAIDCPGGVLSLMVPPMSSLFLIDKGTQYALWQE